MKRIQSINAALVMLLAVLLVTADGLAQGSKRTGTAGALELLLPVGSRGTALGGNYNASISGCEAIFWNPAGVAASDYSTELMASHFNYIADINVNYAAVAAKMGDVGSIGFSVKALDFGDIPVTTEAQPEGTGQNYSPTFLTIGITYSRQMTDRIYFGTTAKAISESILNTSAGGLAFDFGLQYATGVGGLKLGIALKNLGPNLNFGGSDVETRVPVAGSEPGTRARNLRVPLASFELPSTFELGFSYDVTVADKNTLTFAGNFQNHNAGFDQYGVAAEYDLNGIFFVRGAFNLAHDPEENSFRSSEENFLFGPSFGGGVNLDVGGFNLMLDYSYRTAELFDNNQWLTATFGF